MNFKNSFFTGLFSWVFKIICVVTWAETKYLTAKVLRACPASSVLAHAPAGYLLGEGERRLTVLAQFFFFYFLFEKIINSQKIIKIVESSVYVSLSFPQMVTPTVSSPDNCIGIILLFRPSSDFTSFNVCLRVYLHVIFSPIRIHVTSIPIKTQNSTPTKELSSLVPYPIPVTWSPLMYCPSLEFCHFKNVI